MTIDKLLKIGFHVWILFLFLTILFFKYISRQEKTSITNELDSAIDKYVPEILNSINTTIPKNVVNWKKVKEIAKTLKKKGVDPDIKTHNKILIRDAILVIIILFMILIGSSLYFKFYKKYDIDFKYIIISTIIIALLSGIIEVLFFLNIALKYIPVTSSDMISYVIDRIKYHVN